MSFLKLLHYSVNRLDRKLIGCAQSVLCHCYCCGLQLDYVVAQLDFVHTQNLASVKMMSTMEIFDASCAKGSCDTGSCQHQGLVPLLTTVGGDAPQHVQ